MEHVAYLQKLGVFEFQKQFFYPYVMPPKGPADSQDCGKHSCSSWWLSGTREDSISSGV